MEKNKIVKLSSQSLHQYKDSNSICSNNIRNNNHIDQKEIKIYKKDSLSGKLISVGKQKIQRFTVSRDCFKRISPKSISGKRIIKNSYLSKSPDKNFYKKNQLKNNNINFKSTIKSKRQAKSIPYMRYSCSFLYNLKMFSK